MIHAAILSALIGVLGANSPQPPKKPDLLIEAWLSTAGPYGESWSYTLTPSGSVKLHAYFSLNPSGSLMAEFQMADEYVDRVRRAVDSERFFDLPDSLSAQMVMLHRPEYELTVTLGGRKAKTSLYDPEQLREDPGAARFLRIWRELYAGMPIRPAPADAGADGRRSR
jgi:hypothetical protein